MDGAALVAAVIGAITGGPGVVTAVISIRVPLDRLCAMLAAAGLIVTWPPGTYQGWLDLARGIAHLQPLPLRPSKREASSASNRVNRVVRNRAVEKTATGQDPSNAQTVGSPDFVRASGSRGRVGRFTRARDARVNAKL
jgi:hypothetical protein